MRKLLLILFLVGFSNLYSQSLVQTFVDRCTGETKIFTVPMNGQATIVFYDKSRTFTALQFQNGELRAWLEETYLWWASLNPCSTAATNVVTTQAQTQQTTQQATDAAAAATAAAAAATPPPVPAAPPPVATPPTQTASTGTTGTTGTTNPPTNDTSTQNTTGNTQSTGSTDTGGSTSNTDSSSTGSTQSDSTGDTGGSTEGGTSDSSSNDGGSSTEETKTEETKTEETKSEEKTEEVKEESKEETKEETKEESKEEESKEEESKEEEKSEEKEEEKKEEEKSEEKEEEEKKKKKKEKQLAPPIITANVAMMQGVDGTYSYASTFGVSRSSLMGDKTYGLNTMIWSNLQQFMLNANFTKIHINKEGRASRVYSASIGGAKMFTTVMGNMNHSWVFLGKKGSVAGVALGTSITALDLNVVNGLIYYDENILSQSATVFYTKPIPYDRYTISPMLAVSSPFVSLETFSRRTTWSTDVMFIGGVSGTFNITKRFGANLGINAVTSTIPGFPVLINYTIGSRFSF